MYLFGFINPLVYVLFIIIYPFNTNKTSLLILSFILGFSIDLLSNEGGIHAFALVFTAYFRLFMLKIIKGEHFFDDDIDSYQTLSHTSLNIWIFVMIFIHHLLVFTMENFSFQGILQVLAKTVSTTILTYLIVFFIISVFLKKQQHEW